MPAPLRGEKQTLASVIDAFPGFGNKPALLALKKGGVEQWSYAQLADQITRLANGLREAGIKKGDTIALLAENSAEWVVSCLAAIRAGAVATPLDVQFGDEVLRHVLADSAAATIFTTSNRLDRITRAAPAVRPLLLDVAADDSRSWRRLLVDAAGALPEITPSERATLFYTSGTTGPPKGVPLTHRNLAYQIDFLVSTGLVQADDRVVLPLPLHHVYPFVLGMFGPLALGVPLILPRALTGPQIVRALREGNGTVVVGVPRLYEALVAGIQAQAQSAGRIAGAIVKTALPLSTGLRRYGHLPAGKLLLRPLHRQLGPRLRLVTSGGAALPEDLAWRLEGLGWRVATGYGLTETSPLLTINLPGKTRFGTAGRPVHGIELRIDPTAIPGQARVGGTVQGEILARGPSVFAGYRNLPDKTREALTGDGWFRTGDMGWIDDDGYLHITGRVSTLIVTKGGENIQPDDVEAAYRRHPFIRDIGVLQSDDRLVAVVIPQTGEIRRQALDIDTAVRQALSEQSRQLPSYQRIVDYAVTREALPTTRLGKIRRHLLPERYERARQGREKAAEAAGPMPLEEMAAEDRELLEHPVARQVWDWLAQRYPRRRLTPDTSPQLDLGLDSMEWLNLTLAVGQRTGVEISEEAVARIETVRDLLREVIDAAEAGEMALREPPWEHPEQALSARQMRWLRPQGHLLGPLSRGLYGLNRMLMRSLFHLRVEGFEHLPEQGTFIVTPNHASLLDPFIVAGALDPRRWRDLYWGGWTGIVFSNAFMRGFSRLARAVPVDPQAAAASSLALGAAVLKQQKRLVWFPEGRRSPDGKLQSFRPGIGILLAHYPVPVVPIIIRGSRQVLPPGKVVPRPHAIRVEIGAPLDPQALARRGRGDTPQARIVDALHHVMSEQFYRGETSRGDAIVHAK